jgi:hypothetical protein
MDNAGRTYARQFSAAMIGYAAVLIGVLTILNRYDLGAWRYMLVLLPVVPACFGLAAFVGFLRNMDELQRRIQFEAIGFAFAATIVLTFAYGFLQIAGLPAIDWLFVAPIMIWLWGIGLAIASRRYR